MGKSNDIEIKIEYFACGSSRVSDFFINERGCGSFISERTRLDTSFFNITIDLSNEILLFSRIGGKTIYLKRNLSIGVFMKMKL